MKLKTALLALLMGCIAPAAFCETKNVDSSRIVGFYDSEMIKVNYLTFGGITLQSQGFSSGIAMGVSANIRDLLAKYPDSKAALEAYESKNRTGNILLWGGLAAVLGSAYYPILTMDPNDSPDALASKWKTSIYIMLGGLAAELIGAFILPSSFQELFASVNLYNRNAIKNYRAE